MLRAVKNSIDLIRNMGLRYISYRAKHELLIRTGMLKKKFPVNAGTLSVPSLETWHKKKGKFFFENKDTIRLDKNPAAELEKKFNNILSGKFTFFNGAQFDLGTEYDWVTNPENGYKYDTNKHWTEIPDWSVEAGDIKYVWEKSRFSFFV